MNISSLVALLLASFSPLFSFQPPLYEEIEDRSHLPYLNPDLKERQKQKIRLNNGLEILLVSDPQAEESAAALAVTVGSWDDPDTYPGMAHFCEHMLFMGTEKYPDPQSFIKQVTDSAGTFNAFTAPNRTVYMFSSQTEGFFALFDRFAHFFVDPLFDPSCIAREIHAVDQENAKNLEHDGWRELMVFKETGNPSHPNHRFTTGNSETLQSISRSELQKWYQDHYSADRMHLTIYSPFSLEQMKKEICPVLTQVPTAEAPRKIPHLPLFSEKQKGKIVSIEPIRSQRRLSLNWELPLPICQDPSQPAQLLAYALQRGQANSLQQQLKKEQLVDSLHVSVSSDLGRSEYLLFAIDLELTPKGLEEMDQTILRCFQALAGVQTTSLPSYLCVERNQLSKLNYQYQTRDTPFEFVRATADAMIGESLDTFPRKTLLSSEYNPQTVLDVAQSLTPETCFFCVIAPQDLSSLDCREKWYGVPYRIHTPSASQMQSWKNAQPHPAIQIPQPNPFIPHHLSSLPQSKEKHPVCIADTPAGIAYYSRCSEFAAPQSVYHLHLYSPSLEQGAKSSALASLYLDHLTDLLQPTLLAAKEAGLDMQCTFDQSNLHFQIEGFSEKAPLLLQEITKTMPLFPPSAEQFALYFKRQEEALNNQAKELAVFQAQEKIFSFIDPQRFSSQEKLRALRALDYNDFLQFHKKLFETNYLEALFAGNLSQKQAESTWLDIVHILAHSPYTKKEKKTAYHSKLPEGKGPYLMQDSLDVQGNATLLLIEEGLFSFEKRAAQEILSNVMKEAFFHELRSRQKTGYIAKNLCTELDDRLYTYFMVQSSSHDPQELLYRFEQFLEEFHYTLSENIPEERFQRVRDSLVSGLKTRFRDLQAKAELWDLLAFQKGGDFEFLQKRLQGYEALSYEAFLRIADQFISRENHKRVALLIRGRTPHPFAYERIEPQQFDAVVSSPLEEESLESSTLQ